jgi:AraC-like DNA-binding protein
MSLPPVVVVVRESQTAKPAAVDEQPMDVEDLPPLATPDFGRVSDPSRPILSYAWEANAPHRVAAHAHTRAQIIHPITGAYWVATPEGTWLVPTGQAAWIPPNVHHEVYSHGAVSAMMLFVDESFAHTLPTRSGTVEVTTLLLELLRRMVGYDNDYKPHGPAARLAEVMLDELARMKTAPLFLPIARDRRLARAMAPLLDDPASSDTLSDVARRAGASTRTLARLFRTETGMTFPQWKTRLRLVASIERLNRGASITEVALDLGYSTTSAFVYAFRKSVGVSPGRYRAGGSPEPLPEPIEED